MDTEELEVSTPRPHRTHHAHLIFLVSWVPPAPQVVKGKAGWR